MQESLLFLGVVFVPVNTRNEVSLERVITRLIQNHSHPLIVAKSHAANLLHDDVHDFVEVLEILDEHAILVAEFVDQVLSLLQLGLVLVFVTKLYAYAESRQVHIVDSGLELSGLNFSMCYNRLTNLVDVVVFYFR